MMIKVPLVPIKRNHRTQTLFISLFLLIFVLNLLIILPPITPHNLIYQGVSILSTALVLLTFLWVTCLSPGRLQPDPEIPFIELLRDVNPADLCPECKVIRSARSRHCAICNQCVERFDHHCPWINNCVGIKNHNAFLLFLMSIWVKIFYHMIVDSLALFELVKGTDDYECDSAQCQALCVFCKVRMLRMAASILCLVICLFYFFLSSVLLNVHVRNFMANRTTNERFSKRGGKKVRDESDEDDEGN
mmetsp:Transcript_4711/g.8042  ORF Transcript_4711/g.8042 Transcript_4711/m.8042 type:complete len:247 (+) Transcript_4711:2029-2769(+)